MGQLLKSNAICLVSKHLSSASDTTEVLDTLCYIFLIFGIGFSLIPRTKIPKILGITPSPNRKYRKFLGIEFFLHKYLRIK